MRTIDSVIIDTPDPATTGGFYAAAFGLDDQVSVRPGDAATAGFRGFTLSLVVAQPSTVDSLVDSAVAAGAVVLKPAAKSFWGYGGVVQAPDGTICTLASASKKETGSASRQIDDVVLQLGVDDVVASKKFYVEQGLTVAQGFGRTYVQFDRGSGKLTLALYQRRNLAKAAGVSPDGSGSPRLTIISQTESFTDPDGFTWSKPTCQN